MIIIKIIYWEFHVLWGQNYYILQWGIRWFRWGISFSQGSVLASSSAVSSDHPLWRYLSNSIRTRNDLDFGSLRFVFWWSCQIIFLSLQIAHTLCAPLNFSSQWFLSSSTKECQKWFQVQHILDSKHQSPKAYGTSAHIPTVCECTPVHSRRG